jgi:hypothetical protein
VSGDREEPDRGFVEWYVRFRSSHPGLEGRLAGAKMSHLPVRNERTGVPLDARPSIHQARPVTQSDHTPTTGPLDVAVVLHAVKVFRQEIPAGISDGSDFL